MRVFVAGASGLIGRRLVRLLAEAGHEVTGMTRSVEGAGLIAERGGNPVLCDVFDRAALEDVVRQARPDVVVHQLTALPDDATQIPKWAAANNRIRREGTANLLAAGAKAGVARFVVQSVAWPLPDDAGAAVAEMEALTLDAGGVVVRYGQFYGPDTYYPTTLPDPPRIHIDDAARRTVPLLDAASGVVVLTDEP